MIALAAYLACACAAWCGLGLLCLRTQSVRARFGWKPLGGPQRQLLGVGGAVLCVLSLVFALRTSEASFAVVMWVALLGLFGLAMGLLLPWRSRHLVASLGIAAGGVAFAAVLPLLFS